MRNLPIKLLIKKRTVTIRPRNWDLTLTLWIGGNDRVEHIALLWIYCELSMPCNARHGLICYYQTIISILRDCATPLWVYGYLGMKLQNPDNFNPEKVLLRERILTLASWPNKAKSDHHPSFLYSWFYKATLSFTFKSKTLSGSLFWTKKV